MNAGGITRPRAGAILALLIVFHLTANYFWILSDQSYPKGDEPLYLRKSLNLYRALSVPGARMFGELLRAEPSSRVPLFPALASPFYAVAGPSYRVACFSNSVFLLLLILSVYGIGARLGGRGAGLLAALLVSSYPFATEFARKYWSDFALMAVFSFLFLILLKTENFSRRRWSLLFWAVAGAGILIKQLCAFYLLAVIVPAGLAAWGGEFARLRRSGKKYLASLLLPTPIRLNILAGGLLAAGIALPYYLVHREEMRTVFLFGEASNYWTPVLGRGRMVFWTWYLGEIPELTGWFGAGAFLLGLGVLLARPRKSHALLFCWAAGGYLAVSFFEAKLSRYASVLLPALGLVTALGFAAIPGKVLRRTLAGILIGGTAIGYIWNTWGITPMKLLPGWKEAGKWEKNYETVFSWDKSPRKSGDWRVAEILSDISREGREKPLIFVAPYLPYFFPESFRAAAAAAGIDCRVEGPGSPYGGFNFRFLLEADYIVTKDGDLTDKQLERLKFIEPAAELVADPPESVRKNREPAGEYLLPDGSRAYLYRRRGPAGHLEKVETLRRVLAIDPLQVWGWNALGESLLELGSAGEARRAFEEVVRLNPSWTGGYLGLSRAALAEDRLEEASAWVRKSLEITPDWPLARFVQGSIMEKSGDLEGARAQYLFALENGRFDLPVRAREALSRIGPGKN